MPHWVKPLTEQWALRILQPERKWGTRFSSLPRYSKIAGWLTRKRVGRFHMPGNPGEIMAFRTDRLGHSFYKSGPRFCFWNGSFLVCTNKSDNMLKNFQKERESEIQRRAAPLKPIVWWMEGFTSQGVRTRRFLLLLSPLMPGGYQSGMTKSKDYRGCVGIAFFKSEEGN
jgi:hypothetical protein